MTEKKPKVKKGAKKKEVVSKETPREDKSIVVAEVPVKTTSPAVRPSWTREEVELIKQTVAKDATDGELKLFLHTAQKSGLDPFSRQIFFVKRKVKSGYGYKDVASIQTGIDGYRAIAERTGELAGIDDPVYEEEKDKPKKATVTVYRMVDKGAGMKEKVGFTASARWSEYAPASDSSWSMWTKMPFLMLGKCAEALALRKAFPHDLSGIYTAEEMAQADRTNPVPSVGGNLSPRNNERVIQMEEPESQDTQPTDNIKDVDYSEPPFPDRKKEVASPNKAKIFTLLKELGVDTSTKESCEKAVLELTGFDLQESNYERIVERLNAYRNK